MAMVDVIMRRHVMDSENILSSCNDTAVNITNSTRGRGLKHNTSSFKFDITKTYYGHQTGGKPHH